MMIDSNDDTRMWEEAIEAIKNNYPPENYTILREALDLAIELMQEKISTKERTV